MKAARAGVLIVGSLAWEPVPHREAWRRDRLVGAIGIPVRVPIRYGRCSNGRDKTYTMVFSHLVARSDYGLGTGVVVPCRKPIQSPDDLLEEARHLWRAESTTGNPRKPVSAEWGAVGALFHESVETSLRTAWNRAALNEHYPEIAHLRSEASPLCKDGTLTMRWPSRVDGSVPIGVDILLATPTQPTLPHDTRYPRSREIADAWVERRDGEEQYFFRNVESGVRTFQDQAIWKFLAKSPKAGLLRDRYPHAVALLEGDAS